MELDLRGKSFDSIVSSSDHKAFLIEVIRQQKLTNFGEVRRRSQRINIPVYVFYRTSCEIKTAVIKKLLEQPHPRNMPNLKAQGKDVKPKLFAQVTIDGVKGIFNVPLCEEDKLLDRAGVHISGGFCIIASDYGLGTYKAKDNHSEFYYIKQMVDKLEGHESELDDIKHVADLMLDYIARFGGQD